MRLTHRLFVAALALTSCAYAQTHYAWQQLPVQANIANIGLPQLDINQSNQVVGQTTSKVGFISSGGTVQTLGTFGGPTSNAHGINDFGVVAGSADVSATNYHPYTSNGGPKNDLGTLNGGAYANAFDINFYGDVVGQAIDGVTNQRQAYIYLGSGGPLIGLGTLAGSNPLFASSAYGVNNNDEVVGFSTKGDFTSDAFSWTFGGGMVDLGTLGGSFSAATRVNDNGDVVGYSTLAGDSASRGFIDIGGVMQAINAPAGTDSFAMDLNMSDQVVGLYTAAAGTRAFIYEGGSSYDLTALLNIALPSGASVAEAYAINDNGAIAAIGTDGFVYVLTPSAVPEPCSLMALAGFGLVVLKRRSRKH